MATVPTSSPHSRQKYAEETLSVRPLTRLGKAGAPYVREETVEAELRELAALPETLRRTRLLIADRSDPGHVSEETIVYWVREYLAQDHDFSWQLIHGVFERTSSHIGRRLRNWRMSKDDVDECARDLFVLVSEALLNAGPREEFWEVRFWVCLDRRLAHVAERRQNTLDLEVRVADRAGDADDGEPGMLERAADNAPGPDVLLEHKEALDLLTEPERTAVYLCHVLKWPEESDDPERESAARALGVTGRTVRNYLRRAEAKLRDWSADGEAGSVRDGR